MREMPPQDTVLEFAQKRALEYINQGKLKEAIDSMVSDLDKDPSRPEMQKQMIRMMGMDLRNKKDLKKEEVIEWIQGFN